MLSSNAIEQLAHAQTNQIRAEIETASSTYIDWPAVETSVAVCIRSQITQCLDSHDPRITCAHVLGTAGTQVYQPGPYEGRESHQIGIVKHLKIPNLGTNDDACSEQVTPTAAGLDMAIAESSIDGELLSEFGAVTLVTSVRPIEAIRKNDLVTLTGKTRGPIEAKIGAPTLWDQIEFPNGFRCFGRIFELKSATREYVRQALAHPGDSGSWIVFRVAENVAWYGMVISSDGGQAYACFADYILEEANHCNTFPGGLRLLG